MLFVFLLATVIKIKILALMSHFLDIGRVNAYILLQDWRAKNPDIVELHRKKRYNQLDFSIELIRQLSGIGKEHPVPLYTVPVVSSAHGILPQFSEKQFNCKRCYRLYHKEVRTKVFCAVCKKHYCFIAKRNCLADEHEE